MTIKNKRKYDSDMRALYVKLATKYNLTSDEVLTFLYKPLFDRDNEESDEEDDFRVSNEFLSNVFKVILI